MVWGVSSRRAGGLWAGVVDLVARRDGTMRMNELATLHAYWEALRKDGDVPRRADVDPRGIESALDIAFLVERIAPGLARLRLAGMHLNDLMGMDVRGMPLSALLEPDARAGFAEVLERVFDGPAIAELAVRARPGLAQPAREGRMLLLPLRGEDNRVSRALGGLVLQGRPGLPPRRLVLLHQRLIPTDAAARHSAAAPAPGFSDPAAPFGTEGRPRPALRVIRNTDSDG